MMRFTEGARLCALFVFAFLNLSPVMAQMPAWRPQPQTDPLKFGSLRLDPALADSPADGEWSVSISASESNVWAHSWHTFASHRQAGRFGLEVSPDQLRGIEASFPEDAAWHVDLESWRTDVVISRGLGGGISIAARVPYIEIGNPKWDDLAEGFHSLFGLARVERDLFPANDTFLYLKAKNNSRIIEGRHELNGSGMGDTTIALSFPLRSSPGATQRAVLAVELPTGERDTLRGSGGVDLGLSWLAAWSSDRRTLTAAAGYTRLDPDGSFLGAKRSEHLAHLGAGIDQVLWRNLWGTASVRYDTSPLSRIIEAYPGNGSTYYRLGVSLATSRHGWFSFELGEELQPVTGLEADWSFHITWGAKIRGR